jgi:hypothetical protein
MATGYYLIYTPSVLRLLRIADEDLRSRQEASRGVYQDCRGVTADAQRDWQLARQAVSEGRRAFVLVNNRSEGNAPLTVQALAEMQRN